MAVSNGMTFLKPLYWLFGKAMVLLLDLFNDRYFIALLVFTIITRLILFPINLRQQKNMAKTTRLQPKIQKIQKKYANSNDPKDRQKQQEEMQELYNREGHNPMNMGCGPMLFQMLFLMGIIGIIYYPLQYIIGMADFANSSEQIQDVILPIYREIVGDPKAKIQYFQINILQYFNEYKDTLMAEFPKLFTQSKVNAIEDYRSHMYMFGLDMTQTPTFKEGFKTGIVVIPILCLVTSMATSLLSTFIQKKQNPAAAAQGQQMMLMMLMMPLFSFYISFKVSAAVGFYWIISNLVALIQQLVTAKFFPPKRNVARQMIEGTIERRSREESIKKVNE